jgi:hypothetical protein
MKTQMKKTLATCAALAAVMASLASPAFAAHRAPVAADTYGQVTHDQYGVRQATIVTGSGSTVVADPDPNIMTQLLRDPDPSGF